MFVMKKLSFLILFVIFFFISGAQNEVATNSIKPALRKNSFYVETLVILPVLSYDRFLPISEKTGLVLKVGVSSYLDIFFITEASILFGDIKHFFELGIGWGGKNMWGPYGKLGYRYIGKKGLILKAGATTSKNIPIFPTVGIGFSI